MTLRDTHRLGYERVDDDENVAVLIDTMDATAEWDVTIELRRWERHRLGLVEGERLIDVGCGLGDATLALAEDVGPSGHVVGIDISTSMLNVARERAKAAACSVRFTVGDAVALDEPDRSFDAARSERTLQWLTDPQAGVDELARVVRPGGRVSLIDTDWSTLRLDVADAAITELVRAATRAERGRPSNVGGRLADLARAAGLEVRAQTSAAQVWTAWNPDEAVAPDGCFSMRSLADDLVEIGLLDRNDTDRFVATIHDSARAGEFTMSLTMFAMIATTSAS